MRGIKLIEQKAHGKPGTSCGNLTAIWDKLTANLGQVEAICNEVRDFLRPISVFFYESN